MGNLPLVKSIKVSFIKTFTLTNFLEKFQDLDQQFNFLANSDDYSVYYKSLELSNSSAEKKSKPETLVGFGSLTPLKRKHTLHSYWKYFRLTLESKVNNTNNELFLILPLKTKICTKSIHAANQIIPINIYTYLFPFGSCCINMEANIPILEDNNFSKLPKLISAIMTARISDETWGGCFESYSLHIVKKLNEALFADENGFIGEDKNIHTLVFLETEDFGLIVDGLDEKIAVVATMRRNSIEEISYQPLEKINEQIGCVLKTYHDDEIILFTPLCTFIYPSFTCIKKKTTLRCMHDNYCSFLNVIFAVNKFLKDSFLVNKKLPENLPQKRVQEIAKCFTTSFPVSCEGYFNNAYFSELFDPIASKIGLDKRLEIIRSELNGRD
jgi:hypothetical protein